MSSAIPCTPAGNTNFVVSYKYEQLTFKNMFKNGLVWRRGPRQLQFVGILSYTILYCLVLSYTILCYTILYYTILYYAILYSTLLYPTLLYSTLLYYTLLYYTIYSATLYCLVLCSITLHYNIVYYANLPSGPHVPPQPKCSSLGSLKRPSGVENSRANVPANPATRLAPRQLGVPDGGCFYNLGLLFWGPCI